MNDKSAREKRPFRDLSSALRVSISGMCFPHEEEEIPTDVP
jgi:hypothetical protein